MLGKRGETPPLPRNCKRPFFDCTKPLPVSGGKAQSPGSRSRVRRPVPPSSQSALSRAKGTIMFVRQLSQFRLFLFIFRFPRCTAELLTRLALRYPARRLLCSRTTRKSLKPSPTPRGAFHLTVPSSGRYIPRVEAAGFTTQVLDPLLVASGKNENLTVSLRIGPLPQQIVVSSATGIPTPLAQVGSSVSVIDLPQNRSVEQTRRSSKSCASFRERKLFRPVSAAAPLPCSSVAANPTSTKFS